MPGPEQCKWEWDDVEKVWNQISGPSTCPTPPDPRGGDGEITTVCTDGTG